MPRGVVGFSDGFKVTFDLRFRVDREPVPKVLAAFGFEQPFARPFQGEVGVLVSGVHPSKQKDNTKLRERKNSRGLA